MDKNTLIGFVLIAAVLFGFTWYNQPSKEQIEAQRTKDSIENVAKQKAEQIIKDAELTARSTVEEINTQILMKQKEIEDLKKQFEVYKAKMESLLISQLEMLKDSKED